MEKNIMKTLLTSIAIFINMAIAYAQEFPIAVGSDTTFAMSASFDGTNYLIAIKGDNQSIENATAQFVSPSGSLVGSRIFVGSNVSSMGIVSAFDGTNHLLAWTSMNGNVIGRFVSPNGSLSGNEFIIANNASIDRGSIVLTFQAGNYFIGYLKGSGHNTMLWGRTISPSGNLGNEVQISSTNARDISISFDGVNYLFAYVENTSLSKNDLFIRFVSATGALVGNEITVASGNYQRDNPTALAFDGNNYLLAYHEQNPDDHQWFLYGKFINTQGVAQNNFMICDSSLHPMIPFVAYGNNKYLISWIQETNGSMMGQFYDKSGVIIEPPFVIFNTLNNRIPVGGCVYLNNNFLAISTRVDRDFSDGDVYGKFINSAVGISNTANVNSIYAYPNPASDFITLNIITSNASIEMYDILGSLVKSEFINQNKSQLNISDLKEGVYFITIKSSDWSMQQKLIIKK
jgi:hypothetical protein